MGGSLFLLGKLTKELNNPAVTWIVAGFLIVITIVMLGTAVWLWFPIIKEKINKKGSNVT